MKDLAELLAEYPNDTYLNVIAVLLDARDDLRHFSEDDPFLTMTTTALRLIDTQKFLERRCPDLPNLELIMAHYTLDIGILIKELERLLMQDHQRLLDLRQSALDVLESQQKSGRMLISMLLKSSIAIMESRKPDKLGVKTSLEF